ncbi:MAG: BamA/TamA family outer membrane protein [Bryobacterales bacterium]|nr:BamA/TamA family outer membrane protein [Bryobacterales bacterium]
MKRLWLAGFLWPCLLPAGGSQADVNVNSRYTVEAIIIAGEDQPRISSGLRDQIRSLTGLKLNQSALDELADRVRKELRVKAVTQKLQRGSQPDSVKVVFELTRRKVDLDVSVPKFVYHSRQGWTGAVEAETAIGPSVFAFGLVSDNDELAERYAGLRARYEHRSLGTERARLAFLFESYHQQWNRATLEALDSQAPAPGDSPVPGAYRTRQNFQPTLTFVLAKPLTLTLGASFERFQTQFPAARTEAANAVVNTLRYHRAVETSGATKHDLDAGYTLRAATHILSSDFAYARHRWDFQYVLTHERHLVLVHFMAGLLSGQAPLFERYVLGNSSTLRGWNRFDLIPLGGNRVAHNSLEYQYRFFEIFYDTGSVWNRGEAATVRHSLGVGLRKDGFSLAVAFPVKEGRAEPMFMVGMNY